MFAKKFLSLLFCVSPFTTVFAEVVSTEYEGLVYVVDTEERIATLVKQDQSLYGAVTICDVVEYNGVYYGVNYEDGAFKNCKDITSAKLPDSMTIIPNQFFMNCSSLASVNVPDAVTMLGDECFFKCTSLRSVSIPSAVNVFGNMCFSDCSALVEMLCYAMVPPSSNCWAFFGSSSENGTLYVDGSCVEKYSLTDGWKVWGEIKPIPGTEVKVPDDQEKDQTEVHDTIYVEKIVEVHDTIYVEKIVEKRDTIYQEVVVKDTVYVDRVDTVFINRTDTVFIYDDSHSSIVLPTGEEVGLFVKDGVVRVENAPFGVDIEVYSDSGILLDKQTIDSFSKLIILPRRNTYLIKVMGKVYKLVL